MNVSMLKLRVSNVNAANAAANEIQSKMIAAITPYIGTQIVKSSCNEVLARVLKSLPELPRRPFARDPWTPKLHTWMQVSNHSLSIGIQASAGMDGRWYYYEISSYIGNLRGGVLLSTYDIAALPTNYTEDGVQASIAAFIEARKAFETAQRALHPFDEYANR